MFLLLRESLFLKPKDSGGFFEVEIEIEIEVENEDEI